MTAYWHGQKAAQAREALEKAVKARDRWSQAYALGLAHAHETTVRHMERVRRPKLKRKAA